ncbi:MAG: serine/threonine protein kinase [Acidobacteria bacterium]|nr:serine/threonine protein kinase [Acidobacteriota bacterium]
MEERIGPYTVVEELGRGGMGVVYKAHDPSLDRFVAIKVLGTHLTEDPSYVQRFSREARAAAALNHPNIVQVYTIGEDSGRHYFVMEYVKGTSVQELIRKEGRLDPARAAGIVLQAASGLAAAHGAGILHRDIKPGNLMVDERGIVKIADFGLALAPEAATRLTATGMLMGTPGYLSPEQCMDKPADARSDIYSLGATFFEMLAGRTPFTADSPLALLRKIVEVEPPDVGDLNPAVDPELRRIVATMMAKDPAQRYPSCEEIVTDLRQWMEVSGAGSSIPAAGASRAAAAVASGTARSDELGTTPTVLMEGGSGQAVPPPPPPASPAAPPDEVPPPVPPMEAAPPQAASVPPSPTGRKRTVVIAAVAVFLLLGLAAAGIVAWKLGAGPVAALMGSPADHGAAAASENPAPGAATETSDMAAAPQGFGDVSGVEVEQGTPQENRAAAPSSRASTPAHSTAASAAHGAPVPAGHADAATAGSGGSASSSASLSPVAAAESAPAQPPAPAASGTIVLAVGEDLAAGEAGRYLRERLARAGIDLREIDDFPRALDLVENNADPSTNAILSELRGRAARLVLVRVTYLGSRELNYLGRGSTTTESGNVRWTGSGLESRRTYTGGNPDRAHRSRLTVTCYDLATTHTLAPRWSTTVEYTELNAGRNVEKALGDEAGNIIDLIQSGR